MLHQNQWVQKLNQFKKLQRTFALDYTILKSLNEAIQQQQKIPLQSIYQHLLKSLPKQIRQLSLYKELVHSIWMKDAYPIKVRQECSQQILKAVTQWIMQFQVKIDGMTAVNDKFRLVREYIQKNSTNIQMTILIVDQIYEDLRDLFDKRFWNLPQQSLQTCKQCPFIMQAEPPTAQQIIWMLQLLIYRQIQQVSTSKQGQKGNQSRQVQFYLSNYKSFSSQNYYTFILKCLNYLLCLDLDQSHQCQASKLCLQFIRNSYCLSKPQLIINLFRRLMIRTKKSVRYALVGEYVETYEFFHDVGSYLVVQQLEEMVYFRQLIIGHSRMSVSNMTKNLQQNLALKYFTQVSVKAGSKQRVFFSVQDCSQAMIKFQLLLDQGMDINLKIYHLNNGAKQILYHQQPKTQLRKLDLKIKYTGLYAVQFDNSYSWIHGKKILYNIHVMRKVDDIVQTQKHLQSLRQVQSQK